MLGVIHHQLFEGIDNSAYRPGSYKSEQLIKCEDVLNGDSVSYGVPALYARSRHTPCTLGTRWCAHATKTAP